MPTDMPTAEGPAQDFETIDHTADWALRVYGVDLGHLLLNAARGLATLMVENPGTVPQEVERHLVLDTLDAESLLVEWLGELAFWAETESLVFTTYELVEVSETHLKVTVLGGRVPELMKHIKAVTYHELEIIQTETGFTATVVVDV